MGQGVSRFKSSSNRARGAAGALIGGLLVGLLLLLAPAGPAQSAPYLQPNCSNGAFIGEVICGYSSSVTGGILLRNLGDQPLTISSIFFTGPNAGDFSATTDCTTMQPLGPICGISITFTPQAAGNYRSAFLNVVSNDPRSPFVLPVFGLAVGNCGPTCTPCSLTPSTKDFGASAGSQTFMLTNTGSTALTIDTVMLTGASNFQITSQPPSGTMVQPNQSASIIVSFTPPSGTNSTVSTTLMVNPGSPCACSAMLSGTGVAGGNTGGSGSMCSLAPTTMDFGATAGSQAFTLKNIGGSTLMVTSVSLPSSPNFQISSDTGETSLQPNQARTITISFTPPNTGTVSDTLTVNSGAGGVCTASVMGSAASASPQCSLSPASWDFGTAAGSKAFALKNIGGSTLLITSVSLPSSPNFQISNDTGETSLAPNQTRTITISFTPPNTGTVSDTLTVNSGAGGVCTAGVMGSAPPAGPQCSLAPTTTDFGATAGSQAFTLKNVGGSTLMVTSVSLPSSPNFQISSDTGEISLAPNQARTITISFTPPGTGTVSDTLTVNSGTGGVCTATVQGSAPSASPQCGLSPASWDFSTAAGSKAFALKNIGGSTLLITSVSLPSSPNFQISNDTGETSLAPNQTRTITISFTPPNTGTVSDTLTVNSGAGGVCTASVMGSAPPAGPQCSLSPSSKEFGTTAGSQVFTLKNIGGSTLMVTSVSLPSSPNFQISSDTGETSLQPNQTRSITISFTPPATGTVSDTLTISSGAGGVCTASVAGSAPPAGPQCSLSPSSKDFGTTAGSQAFTLKNIGGSTLMVTSVSLPSSPNFQISSDTGETSLAPNQTRTITITFTPPTSGSASDTLTINSSTGGVCTAAVTGEARTCPPLSITCLPDRTVCTTEGQCGATGVTITPTVTPNAAGTTVSCVRSDGLPLTAPYPFGTTTVTCTATDACGNTATCTQRVTVVPGGQTEVRMSVAGGSDQVTMNVGDCISLQMLLTVAGCSFVQDITGSTVFATDPARGTFHGNVFCATAAEANHEFPIYGTYFNPCSGTYVTATVSVTVRRNDGQH